MYELTPEEQATLLNFVEGNDAEAISTNVIGKVAALNERITNSLLERCRSLEKVNARLTARLEKLEAARERRYVDGEFDEMGLSAELILKATYYAVGEYAREHQIKNGCSVTRAVLIMFEVYANWLEKRKTRICVDHPVAINAGPWWWGAVKSITKPSTAYKDSFDKLAVTCRDLLFTMKATTKKYMYTPETDLKKFICECPAYTEATDQYNNGKWNKVLDDGKIYLWRKDVLASRA